MGNAGALGELLPSRGPNSLFGALLGHTLGMFFLRLFSPAKPAQTARGARDPNSGSGDHAR
jgi:hypothetical protein